MTLLPLLSTLYLAAPNPPYVREVLERWQPLDIEVEVVSRDCGYVNAYYYPADRMVVMCTELYEDPELARFVLNHELAHAFNRQHGLDWAGDEEFKADELAFLMSDGDEVLAAIRWFLDRAEDSMSADPHPADLDRAAMLICLDEGFHGLDRRCNAYYRSALSTWNLLVNQTEGGE